MRSLAAALFLLGTACIGVPAQGDEQSARRALKAAFVASDSKDSIAAYKAITEAIHDAGFAGLDPGAQHAALQLAYTLAYEAKHYPEAQDFATRATELPSQSIEDWQYRQSAAAQLKDYRDEAKSIMGILARGGVLTLDQNPDAVRRAYADTKSPQFHEVRGQMLLALYERGWRPTDGSSASSQWLALSLHLLEDNQVAKAQEVARLIDESLDVIAVRSDLRYKSLLKSRYFQSDAHQAARTRLEVLRHLSAERPRSLFVLLRLARALQTLRKDEEVLALTTVADKAILASPSSAPPYDDIARNHPWILNAKADALVSLGRFEEAVAELRRAIALPKPSDTVSQAINLAGLLSQLGRTEDALAVLPNKDGASDYGKTQIALVRLAVMMERQDAAGARVELQYLRDHQDDSPWTLQRALVIAGENTESEKYLLSRLTDPEKRTDALIELQTFSEPKLPPQASAWRAEFAKLEAVPSIRQAALRVGALSRYTWRCGPGW